MIVIAAVLIGLGAMYVGRPKQSEEVDKLGHIKVRIGDDMAWKDPDIDDSNWHSYPNWQREAEAYQGNLWIRIPLEMNGDKTLNTLVLAATGSAEVYFDGEPIGHNGVVGATAAEEASGSLIYMCTIPNQLLQAGPHLAAVRFSNHKGVGGFYMLGTGVGSIQDVLSYTRRSLAPFLCLSAFLVVALYFTALFGFNRRHFSHLTFALLCGLTGLLLFVEGIRAVGYPYDWHGYRLGLVTIISGVLSALVPLFFIQNHAMRRIWTAGIPIALLFGAVLSNGSPDKVSYGFFYAGFLYAQVLVCVAFWHEKADAWIGVLGVSQLITILAVTGMSFMERSLFLSMTLLILLILVSLGLQNRRERAQFQEAQLRSARLQIELLKKHLRPHFMLNTLTAVMEWLERDPKAGVAFIGLLAEEMKVLNGFADKTLVPLADELNLCRNHLNILAYRNEESYRFDMDCQNPELAVPPAVILTLVENGISYALDEVEPAFGIRQWIAGGSAFLEFKAAHVDIGAGKTDEGTGTKYIRARLEESFPDCWELSSSGKDTTWTTRIVIEGNP